MKKKETILNKETKLFFTGNPNDPRHEYNLEPEFEKALIKVESDLGTMYLVTANNFNIVKWYETQKLFTKVYKSKAWAMKQYKRLHKTDLENILK